MWPLALGQSSWVGDNYAPGVTALLTFQTPLEAYYGAPKSQALSADGRTLAVGGDGYPSGGVGTSGAVFIFGADSEGKWSPTELFVLSSSTPKVGGAFGTSLALSAAGDTLLVGSPGESTSGARHGAAYFFTRAAGTWSPQQKVLPSSLTHLGDFSRSVSLSYDGLTAAVSWTGGQVAGVACGVVYIYTSAAGVWSLQQTVEPPAGDQLNALGFGTAVALSGDGNTLAVSVNSYNNTHPRYQGVIVTYTRSGGVWAQQGRITDPDIPAAVDGWLFGLALALSENGKILAVGSYNYNYDSVSHKSPGALHMYSFSGLTWVLDTRVAQNSTDTRLVLGESIGMDKTGKLLITTHKDSSSVYSVTYGGQGVLYGRLGDAWSVLQEFDSFAGANLVGFVAMGSDGTSISIGNGYTEGTRSLVEYVIDYAAFTNQAGGVTNALTSRVSLLPGGASPWPATVVGVTLTTASSLLPGSASSGAGSGTTVLLLHLNGANNSQVFTDSSASPLTFVEDSSSGTTVLSTSGPKLGSAALQTGALGDALRAAMTSKVQLGTGAWNIQFFVYLDAAPDTDIYCLVIQETSTTLRIILEGGTGNLQIQTDSALTTFSTTSSVGVGSWQHVEVSKDGSGVIRGFIQGALLGTTVTDSSNFGSAGLANIYFGYDDFLNPMKYDELRIVKGSAVHTASFTPPTAELS